MKIGLIVDGVSEYRSLNLISARIENGRHVILPPLKANIQPSNPAGVIVSRCREQIANVFVVQPIDRLIVLIDLDKSNACAIVRAKELQDAFDAAKFGLKFGTYVVLKNDRFENWLVADTHSFLASKKFALTASQAKAITGRADDVDATELLHTAARVASGKAKRHFRYDKVSDAKVIMSAADPYEIARNSRSFRRFLKLVGCTTYSKLASTK